MSALKHPRSPFRGGANSSVTQDLESIYGGFGDDLDPSLADGYTVYFEREVPVEIRAADDGRGDTGTVEAIRFKILTIGPASMPASVRVELTSEADIYFLYVHEMNEVAFRELQDNQRLTWGFDSYPALLVKMLLYCVEDPSQYTALFSMQRNFQARLDVVQNMDYKVVDIISTRFGAAPEELVKSHVSYRYNSLKHRLGVLQAHVNELNGVIRAKNPSLLLNLGRRPAQSPAAGGAGLAAQASQGQGQGVNASFASTRLR